MELTASQKAWITFRDKWLINELEYEIESVADFATKYRTDVPPFLRQHEEPDYIYENSQNPYEVCKQYLLALRKAEGTKAAFIAENLCAFPEESFARFGDRNWLTDKIRVNYCKPDGIQIDVAAQEITASTGITTSPQDIVDFVVLYPAGPGSYFKQSVKRWEKLFHQLTTFTMKDYYAQYLIDVCENVMNPLTAVSHEDCPF
jgi:hypothetical protein